MKKIPFLLLIFPFCVAAQLKINEIMPNNVSAIMDESYNYSMWVELYNAGNGTMNWNTCYFSDNINQPYKWRPSKSKSIAPGEFGILWFERQDRENHANFKLSPEGGTLYLFSNSGEMLDQVSYPISFRNISYGRKIDGTGEWTYFETPSPESSNNGKKQATVRCEKPVFNLAGGFYSGETKIGFVAPISGDSIYYTINGDEPTRTNAVYYTPGQTISLHGISIIRAKTFSKDKLSSDIVSKTYFVNARNFDLPVVSIITEQANMTDDIIGIYVDGTNGIPGRGTGEPVNWNQDWDRPANFELFNVQGATCLNQELDIAVTGGWSRGAPSKSLKIQPRKKFGDNRLRYDIFSSKPGRKYKDIQLRNSGNDFYATMMRDALLQTVIIDRMDIDYLAYEPAVCFINGEYHGILNIRERSNKDYLYTNYDLDEEEFVMGDVENLYANQEYVNLINYLNNNDLRNSQVYAEVERQFDIDSYLDYMMTEMYAANTDWPGNNFKVWKKKENGKWRWILFDTDYSFNLYNGGTWNHNTLEYVLQNQGYVTTPLVRMMLNDTFRKKFIDRFSIQLSSTFEANRVIHIMDSLASRIQTEIVYHKALWGGWNFESEVNIMRPFGNYRPDKMMEFLSSRFFNSTPVHAISLSSNISQSNYKFNNEKVVDNKITLKYFQGQTISIESSDVPGYRFDHWELSTPSSSEGAIPIPMGSNWNYWDSYGIPDPAWHTPNYNDNSWKKGNAPLGYGNFEKNTTIEYGPDSNNKYTTAYFRKKININNLNKKDDFSITAFIDDGAAIYANGHEIGRFNLPPGDLLFNTYSNYANNGETTTFAVPKEFLNEGDNLIAAEVHQCAANSSDLIFDLSLSCNEYSEGGETQTIETPVFSTQLGESIVLKAIYRDNGLIDPNENAIVLINEIVAENTVAVDEYGEKDDYIELYNAGDTEVNIAGWYLTDTPSDRKLARIPTTDSTKTVIPSKGRIIIWADGQPEQGILHVGFKLAKEGETLVFSRENPYEEMIEMDRVSYPALDDNKSYSRVPDGSNNWVIQSPTFNASNTITLSIAEKQHSIRLYPTVTEDYIIIENAFQKAIRMYDITGKLVLETQCTTANERIEIASLPKGVYIVKIENAAFKIIKK
jgi:hypothetical protein